MRRRRLVAWAARRRPKVEEPLYALRLLATYGGEIEVDDGKVMVWPLSAPEDLVRCLRSDTGGLMALMSSETLAGLGVQ